MSQETVYAYDALSRLRSVEQSLGYFDEESELHDNGFRTYSSELGRYLQSDPLGLAAGINNYDYVGGNPVSWTDPLGLEAISYLSQNNWGIPPPGGPGLDQYVGAAGDFVSGYTDQALATEWYGRAHNGWANQDKYFHCRVNCEASQRGPGGESAAECLSNAREAFDQLTGDSPSASEADQEANLLGRTGGAGSPTGNCRLGICGSLRPGGSFPPKF